MGSSEIAEHPSAGQVGLRLQSLVHCALSLASCRVSNCIKSGKVHIVALHTTRKTTNIRKERKGRTAMHHHRQWIHYGWSQVNSSTASLKRLCFIRRSIRFFFHACTHVFRHTFGVLSHVLFFPFPFFAAAGATELFIPLPVRQAGTHTHTHTHTHKALSPCYRFGDPRNGVCKPSCLGLAGSHFLDGQGCFFLLIMHFWCGRCGDCMACIDKMRIVVGGGELLEV